MRVHILVFVLLGCAVAGDDKCLFKVAISGCGATRNSATKVMSASYLKLSAVVELEDSKRKECLFISKSYKWFLVDTVGELLPIGEGETISVWPAALGNIDPGLVTAHVKVSFNDLNRTKINASCYVIIVQSNFTIWIDGWNQDYECGVHTKVRVSAYAFMAELNFKWICPPSLCQGDHLNNSLIFNATVPCGLIYKVKLNATDPVSKETYYMEGTLNFVLMKPYGLKVICEPDCNRANPDLPLTVSALGPKLGDDFQWILPGIKPNYECQESAPRNVLIIQPRALAPGSTYIFHIQTLEGNMSFAVETTFAPRNLNCHVAPKAGWWHKDKFNVSCSVQSDDLIVFSVYEGLTKDLVTTSNVSNMTNLEISASPLQIEAVNSVGMRLSVNLSIDGAVDESIFMTSIPSRVQRLKYLLHEKQYGSVANDVDVMTKFTVQSLPLVLRYYLMDTLGRIPLCEDVNCVFKIVNSVRRLIGNVTLAAGVDELIFRASATLYTMVKSLPRISPRFGAYELEFLLDSLHSVTRTVMKLKDDMMFLPYLPEDIRRIHYKKVEKGNEYCRLTLSLLGLFITSHLPHPAYPFELDSGNGNEKTIILSHHPNFINCMAVMNKTDSFVRFSKNAIDTYRENLTEVSAAMTLFHKDNFWWTTTADSENSLGVIIGVFIYERKPTENWSLADGSVGPLRGDIHISNLSLVPIKGVLYKPKRNVRRPTELDKYIDVHRVVVPQGYGTVYIRFPEQLVGFIYATVNQSVRPSYDFLDDSLLVKAKEITYNYYSQELGVVYIGIWPRVERMEYSFLLGLVRCGARSEDMWKSEQCIHHRHLETTTTCYCRRTSVFTALTSLPMTDLVSKSEIGLIASDSYNWYAMAFIIAVVFFLSIIFGIALGFEKTLKMRKTEIFLRDNWPGERYPYLIAVYTGSRCSSGTTSHVAIRLIGDQAISRVHILASTNSSLECMEDSWFILFCDNALGIVQEIELWHDHFGTRPQWYCTEVIIWDFEFGHRFKFPINEWLSHSQLYLKNETSFKFSRKRPKKMSWESLVMSHFHSYMRQEHHWASIFVLHPRSKYSRLDRAMLLSITILVSITSTMVFYMTEVGPADSPQVRFTTTDIYISIFTMFVTFVATLIPATMFNLGNEFMKYLAEGWEKRTLKQILYKYFIRPISYKPILSHHHIKSKIGNMWKINAYIVSAMIITTCITLIVAIGWDFGRNRSTIWFIVSLVTICCQALIVNPIHLVIISFIVARAVRMSARDIVVVDVGPIRDPYPLEDTPQRLKFALANRVRSWYKPPLRSVIKEKATKEARLRVFDVFHIVIVVVLLILLSNLVSNMGTKLNFYKNRQLIDDFSKSDSSPQYDLALVLNRTRYFDYLRATVLPALHRITWYNGKFLTMEPNENDQTFVSNMRHRGFTSDYSSKVFGVPRLRQQRVTRDTITIKLRNSTQVFERANELTLMNEDTKTYLKEWQVSNNDDIYYRKLKYRTADETREGYLIGPSRYLYGGGGYVEHLYWSLGKSHRYLIDLELEGWLDNTTRSLFFSVNLYNLYVDVISSITIVTECLPSGVYTTRALIESTSVNVKYLPRERAVAAITASIAIILSAYMSRVITTMSELGASQYVKTLTGFINVTVILAGCCFIVTFVIQIYQFGAAFTEVESAAKDSFTPLYWRFAVGKLHSIVVGVFCLTVAALSAATVYRIMGFEPIKNILTRTRRLILILFATLIVVAFYFAINLYYFGSAEIPNLFYLLFFKETTALQHVIGPSRFLSEYLMVFFIVYTVVSLLNVAILCHLYGLAGALIEPKHEIVRRQLTSIASRFETIQSLKAVSDKKGKRRWFKRRRKTSLHMGAATDPKEQEPRFRFVPSKSTSASPHRESLDTSRDKSS